MGDVLTTRESNLNWSNVADWFMQMWALTAWRRAVRVFEERKLKLESRCESETENYGRQDRTLDALKRQVNFSDLVAPRIPLTLLREKLILMHTFTMLATKYSGTEISMACTSTSAVADLRKSYQFFDIFDTWGGNSSPPRMKPQNVLQWFNATLSDVKYRNNIACSNRDITVQSA
jgi:hypothetical protein